MTTEGATAGPRRFPIGLTLAAAIALVVLVALGAWQIQRLKWKQALLAKIAALATAPARPLGPVLAVGNGVSAEFTRVAVECGPPPAPAPRIFRYSLRQGQVGWRLMTACPLAAGAFDSIVLDRGLVTAFTGAMAPRAVDFPAAGAVTGILRSPGGASLFDSAPPPPEAGVTALRVIDAAALGRIARRGGFSRPAPWILAVESERPAPAGVVPAALPEDIPNNHFVYALTWFGIAGALIGVYIAMLARRLRGP
ncbi:MAG TPA: SURF1 family cytochrome oxidase biogenesis protein [Caulobacteraceae bacterium]|nr:SURF1 family cytochrome oxidase biogenesis protein [Caulobacteraceae bacterium]